MRLQPRVTCVKFRGLAGPGARESVSEELPALLDASAGDVHHFVDLSELGRPDAAVRNAYMSLLLEHRASLAAMHCLFNDSSVLVSLMVTAGNIALGGSVRMYNEREAFERAMRNANDRATSSASLARARALG